MDENNNMRNCLRCNNELFNDKVAEHRYSRKRYLCKFCIRDIENDPDECSMYKKKYKDYAKKLNLYREKNFKNPTPSGATANEILDQACNLFCFKLLKECIYEPYIIDFVIQYNSIKVGIEIDGGIHDKQLDYDDRRDEFILSTYKLPIYRFENSEIPTNKFQNSVWTICYGILENKIKEINRCARKKGIIIPNPFGCGEYL